MKILILSEYFPSGKELRFSGGVEARNYFVAKNLARKHKVTIISSRAYGQKKEEKMFGFNIVRVGAKRNYNATAGNLLERLIFTSRAINRGTSLDIDIVEGTNFITHFVAKRISQKNNIPVVYWYPDVFIGQWLKTTAVVNGFLGFILEKYNLHVKANCFIAISGQTTTKLVKNHINPKIIKTIPCGIEPYEFVHKVVKEKPPVIICISRLVSYKHVEDIIWAFVLIARKKIKCTLKIIGRGPEQTKLKSIVKMLKLKRSVHFYENLPRKGLIKILKASSILCSASEVEGFGINIIEAAASGVPYVLSNIKIFKEITKNGKGALMFKTRDIKDLSEKLTTLLLDNHVYLKKQKEALTLAESYKWEKISRDTEKVYQSLL